jgi:hypothetical protein
MPFNIPFYAGSTSNVNTIKPSVTQSSQPTVSPEKTMPALDTFQCVRSGNNSGDLVRASAIKALVLNYSIQNESRNFFIALGTLLTNVTKAPSTMGTQGCKMVFHNKDESLSTYLFELFNLSKKRNLREVEDSHIPKKGLPIEGKAPPFFAFEIHPTATLLDANGNNLLNSISVSSFDALASFYQDMMFKPMPINLKPDEVEAWEATRRSLLIGLLSVDLVPEFSLDKGLNRLRGLQLDKQRGEGFKANLEDLFKTLEIKEKYPRFEISEYRSTRKDTGKTKTRLRITGGVQTWKGVFDELSNQLQLSNLPKPSKFIERHEAINDYYKTIKTTEQ